MKNLIFFLLLSLTLLSSACSSEIDEPFDKNESNTTIQIQIPALDDLKTRAFSDGLSVNTLKCYVYDRSKTTGAAPVMIEDIPMHVYSGHKGAYYSMYLPNFTSYDLVFLATSGRQDNATEKIYYNQTARTIDVNYDAVIPNDENLDCFWGVITNVNPENSKSYQAILKRPFAQLNIGTKDLSTYNEMSSSSLQSVAVGINGVYKSMNAMDGKVTGKTNISFPAASRPSGQTFPVSGNDFLSMNYILVNERTNIDVLMTAYNATQSFVCTFNTIPIQRNYRTNVYGNLLTASNEYKVEIVPDFDGSEDKDVNKYGGYDVVMKLVDNHKDIGPVKLRCSRDIFGFAYSEIDLTPYVDNTNTLKFNWQAFALDFDPVNISFANAPIETVILLNLNALDLKSLDRLFSGCRYLEEWKDITNTDTSNIESMRYMFSDCKSLRSLDLTEMNTSNVTDMYHMFHGCDKLEYLDLSKFDTKNVTDMTGMFGDCENLTSLDLSNFDTKKVTDMQSMFWNCSGLTSLDLSNFDTKKVTDMQWMFWNCLNLTNLNVSSFDTSKVTTMRAMFENCENLTSLNLKSFDGCNAITTANMFSYCRKLVSIDFSHFDTANVTDMSGMFAHCINLASLDLSSFNTSKVTNMYNMFTHCENLTSLDLSNFNTSNVTNMSGMFSICTKLASLKIPNFNTKKVTDMSFMFTSCDFTSLDVSSFDTSNVTDMSNLFSCHKLKSIDLSKFDTKKVTDMTRMFFAAADLTNLDLSSFDTSKVTTMEAMFCNCSKLASLDVSSFNTFNVTNMSGMFQHCDSLLEVDLSSFDTHNVPISHIHNMFNFSPTTVTWGPNGPSN